MHQLNFIVCSSPYLTPMGDPDIRIAHGSERRKEDITARVVKTG
jgi:hypothetical protein